MHRRATSPRFLFPILAVLAWTAMHVPPNAPGASVLVPVLCAPGLLALLAVTGGNVHDGAGLGAAAATALVVVVSAGLYTFIALGLRRLARLITNQHPREPDCR